MSAPAVVIRLELEALPKVLVDALDEREHTRLIDWIEAHPAYQQLIAEALELERQERAA
jgi:hypothetical protein